MTDDFIEVLRAKIDKIMQDYPDDSVDDWMMRAALAGTTFGADCLEGLLRVHLASKFPLPLCKK